VSPDAGGVGEARGGRGASVRLLEQLRGIGRKCAFYNGFAGSVPKKTVPTKFFVAFLPYLMAFPKAMCRKNIGVGISRNFHTQEVCLFVMWLPPCVAC